MNSISMAGIQPNTPNMSPSVQHLAPGSPLLPMGSPLPMFDVSPFQVNSIFILVHISNKIDISDLELSILVRGQLIRVVGIMRFTISQITIVLHILTN